MSYWIGIDLGGSSAKYALLNRQGELLDTCRLMLDAGEPGVWPEQVRSQVRDWRRSRGEPAGIGLAAPGLAAADNRSIAHMPDRLPGLEGLNWSDFLGFPSVPVLNDAHAALLGEVWKGAAQGRRHALLLTLGTGVGGAVWADGRLLQGSIGRAGHLGHMSLNPEGVPDICGTPGSLEWAIGNYSLPERSGGRFDSTETLVQAAAGGDASAREIWDRSLRALSAAIVSLINALDPEVVVLGGGITHAGPLLFEPVRRWVSAMEWKPGGRTIPVVPAQLGSFAGAFGAAWMSRRDLH